MKLIGSGIDIVETARIEKLFVKYPDSFAYRILHTTELQELERENNKVQFLANRFCVKESIAKAFGTGMRGEMSWRNIYVSHDELGKPIVNFENKLARQIQSDNVELTISISHEKNYTVSHAIAFEKE